MTGVCVWKWILRGPLSGDMHMSMHVRSISLSHPISSMGLVYIYIYTYI